MRSATTRSFSMACGLPGKMSKVGLGTFIDPRVEGGKMNERTRSEPDISEIVEYHGEEYLMYNEVPIDTLLIRGTTCDEMGNMFCSEGTVPGMVGRRLSPRERALGAACSNPCV